MIGLVLVTHGRLADELRATMEHVVGPQRNVGTVCIGPDDDMDRRRSEIRALIAQVDTGDGVVVLTDMFGGTPSNLGHLHDDPRRGGGAVRRQLAYAGQTGQGPLDPNACRVRRMRPGRRAQIHCCRFARAPLLQESGIELTDATTPASATALTRIVTVINRRGLHARAAAKFVTLAERFGASVEVSRDGQSVSARSIMGLMMLGAGKGATMQLQADGWDAKEALEALVSLVEAGFNEQD